MRYQSDRFLVVGGSIAGLMCALGLARAGASVVVVERDVLAEAPHPDAAFGLERPGVPHAHFLHVFLARMVAEFRRRWPDVLETLREAGARLEPMGATESSRDVELLFSRRTTVEWVLRRAVRAEANVEVLDGRTVVGLELGTAGEAVPLVTGARLDDGSLLEGTVVACTGRRGDPSAWLRPAGVKVPEQLVSSELVYVTRWYRLARSGQPAARVLGDLGYLLYLSVPGDAQTLAVAAAIHASDRELRTCLLDDSRFDRVVAQLPGLSEAVRDGQATPLRSSQPMAGLVNRLLRFVDGSGAPLVGGFHAAGDAHTCTNPAYGRGCSLAAVQAGLLVDAALAHPNDPLARASAYESANAREVEPWYHNSVFMDAMRQRRRVEGDRPRDSSGPDFGALFAGLLFGRVRDPLVAAGIARAMNLLVTPQQLLADGTFVSRAIEVANAISRGPRRQDGPRRDQLLEVAA